LCKGIADSLHWEAQSQIKQIDFNNKYFQNILLSWFAFPQTQSPFEVTDPVCVWYRLEDLVLEET
jgi:hypothetical protein